MRMKRFRLLFGSARSRYFKEPKRVRASYVRRDQKVRFRRRAAASVFKSIGLSSFRLVQFGVVAALFLIGGKKGFEFWQMSPTIRVEKVQFKGPVPKGLPENVGIKAGDNIFKIKGTEWEDLALRRFPELKTVRIFRRFDRTVLVEVERRTPVAHYAESGHLMAVDLEGMVFPLLDSEKSAPLIRLECQSRKDLLPVLKALTIWKREVPEFYSMVKSVETDKMRAVTIGLQKEVFVRWGGLDDSALVKRAQNILTLCHTFAPRAAMAELRFITDDRVVMDSKWMRISFNND